MAIMTSKEDISTKAAEILSIIYIIKIACLLANWSLVIL